MTDLVWHDFLELGIDFIDDDHKELLNIMQKIKTAVDQSDFEKCVQFLQQLLEEARAHFAREEAFLEKTSYPHLAEHKAYHQDLLNQAETTKQICEGIETEHDLQFCFDNMANFLIDDILRGDIHFKSYLEYEGFITDK